jgi:hypothetical protein
MRRAAPDLYAQLAGYFNQDPLEERRRGRD